MKDSTTRFSTRVTDYVRYRPRYPPEVLDLLTAECELTSDSTVADIGSGTGLLSRLFVEAGYKVIGVEPNAEMRAASPFPAIAGTAERTMLPDHSVDLIVAGQAFHWFEPERTKAEWMRILKPRGGIALIWNERLRAGAFMNDLEDTITRFAAEPEIEPAGIDRFFAPSVPRVAEFPNQQQFDRNGLRGRVLSCSYMPLESAALTEALDDLFERHNSGGAVTVLYTTKVFYSGV